MSVQHLAAEEAKPLLEELGAVRCVTVLPGGLHEPESIVLHLRDGREVAVGGAPGDGLWFELRRA